MNYNTEVSNFCEKRLIGLPEWFSSLSALFISATGLVGLRYSHIQNRICYNLLSLLIINGIASCLYHTTGWYLFKHLDEIPMIIAVWFGIMYILDNYSVRAVYLVCDIMFVIILAVNTIPSFQHLFPIFFGIPLASMIPLICYELHKHSSNPNKKISLHLATNGILLCIVSAATWIISELWCQWYMILSHSMWHMGMALGLYYVIIALNFLNAGPEFVLSYKFFLFPIINLKH